MKESVYATQPCNCGVCHCFFLIQVLSAPLLGSSTGSSWASGSGVYVNGQHLRLAPVSLQHILRALGTINTISKPPFSIAAKTALELAASDEGGIRHALAEAMGRLVRVEHPCVLRCVGVVEPQQWQAPADAETRPVALLVSHVDDIVCHLCCCVSKHVCCCIQQQCLQYLQRLRACACG